MPTSLRTLLAALAACLALAACSHELKWRTSNIDGMVPDLAFKLTDDTGRVVTAKDYAGKTVLLYFGYTSCPDVCPTTLSKLGQALKQMDKRGARIQVLFVTADPKRDTVQRLHEYVQAFGPWLTGLRGSQDELHELAKRYRVSYSYGKPDKDGNYEVTHSSGVFVFDGTGRSKLLILPRNSAAEIGSDLDQLRSQ